MSSPGVVSMIRFFVNIVILLTTIVNKVMRKKLSAYQDVPFDLRNSNLSLTKIFNWIPECSRVIDFGCATGVLASGLVAKKQCDVTGVDLNEVDLALAGKVCSQVILADLEKALWLDEVSGAYDVAIFSDVLEHLRKPSDLLRRARRILKPEAEIVVSFPNITHVSVLLELMIGRFRYEKLGILDETHYRFFDKESLFSLLQHTGYNIQAVNPVRETFSRLMIATYFEQHSVEVTKDMVDYLLQIPHSDVYQWVIKARVGASEERFRGVKKPFEIRSEVIANYEKAISGLKSYSSRLERGAESRVERIEGLEDRLSVRDEEIYDLRLDVEGLRKSLLEKDECISVLTNRFDQKQKHIEHLEKEVLVKENAVQVIREVLQRQETRMKVMKEDFRKKDLASRKLLQRTKEYEKLIVGIQQDLEQKDRKCSCLQQRLDEREAVIKDVRREVLCLKHQVDVNDKLILSRMPRVDIVTVNYNGKKYLKDYLKSISQIDYPIEKLHVMIIDNASTDASVEYCEEMISELSYVNQIRLPSNSGFTGGNNMAFRVSQADYILMLNIDTEITPDCLKRLVERMEDDRKIGLCEAKQVPYEHPKRYDEENGETAWCSAACLLVRRNALDEVGLFDERFFLYCEDVDLSWRMWSRGWKCVYNAKAVCIHHTLDPDDTKKGPDLAFLFGIRNGVFMRFIYGSFREYLSYLISVWRLILFSREHSLHQRKIAFLASLSHFKHFFHLLKRRRVFRSSPKSDSKWITFYGWDYADRR